MTDSTTQGGKLRPRPIDHYDRFDSEIRRLIDLDRVRPDALAKLARIRPAVAGKIVSVAAPKGGTRAELTAAQLAVLCGASRTERERLDRARLRADGTRMAIVDVRPGHGRIMSGRPFTLDVEIARCRGSQPVLASVIVAWAGEPFVVEQEIRLADRERGVLSIAFGKEQALPPGPAVFAVSVFDDGGAQSRFRRTCLVLPSNPLSLHVSPRTDFVTGTYSARGVKESDGHFRTRIGLSIANGDAGAVTIQRHMSWKFWDGGVGGTLVEGGTHDWGGSFSVPGHGSWSGSITVSSPPGSGIYNRYADKEDMTIEIAFTASDGRTVSDTLTARVMVAYGLNVTRIDDAAWTAQEYQDLYDAVEVTRSIYEARDLSFTGISRRFIPSGSSGGFSVMDSDSEVRDCFDDWSGPGNDYIDTFISHGHTTGFDGLAGDIPGPTHHDGRKSGVWADKTGFVDASGTKRLHVNYLGMLIGHELGHYLGLSHIGTAGNLMLSSSGTNDTDLSYDQYKAMLDHGWVFIA